VKSRVTTGVRWRPTFLLCLAVLAGCGSGSGARHTALLELTPIGMRTVATPDFSIQIPKGWRSLDRRSAVRPSRIRPFLKTNPRLRAELQAFTGPNSPIELLAVSPVGAAFRANMNVIQTRIPKSLSFAAGRALRLVYRVRRNGVVFQYFVKHEGFLYVLTYTAALAAASHYGPVFDTSAHTFALR